MGVPAVAVICRAGVRTTTVLRHGAAEAPAGQVDPVAAEDAVITSSLSPVSGLLTVTVNVTVTVAPGARLPVQVRTGAA